MTTEQAIGASHPKLLARACIALVWLLSGCVPGPHNPEAERPERAQKWYLRAVSELRAADVDGARDSVRHALDLVPEDPGVRLVAARVALARLEQDEVLRLLRGVKGSAAAALRGRAAWYKGDLERAADELEALLADPEVDDPWAQAIVKLARTGAGRKPFELSTTDGRLAAVQLVRVAPGVPLYVVPLEIDGEEALALVATGTAEVMVDSATRHEPSWVSLRFGRRLEVKDVPALTRDLSGLSRQLGAPIKALLGVNLLRHLNVTLDHRGRQLVARTFVPPPPPMASRVDLYYLRGGAMVVRSGLGDGPNTSAALIVDSSMSYSVALDAGGWKKLGINPASLPWLDDGGGGKLRGGAIPLLHFGAFELPQVSAVQGPPIARLEKDLGVDVDGVLGAGLLSTFRITLSDNGRVLWIERPPPLVPLGPAGHQERLLAPTPAGSLMPGADAGSLLSPTSPSLPPIAPPSPGAGSPRHEGK